jgi:hypothetical protein
VGSGATRAAAGPDAGFGAPATHPATVYHGRSVGARAGERVHVAAPLLGVARERTLDAATLMDSMPVGGLRLLGEYLHVHDSLPLPGVDPAILDPRDTYADASEWEEKAKDLAGRFIKNFKKYETNEAGKALVAAGPQA